MSLPGKKPGQQNNQEVAMMMMMVVAVVGLLEFLCLTLMVKSFLSVPYLLHQEEH